MVGPQEKFTKVIFVPFFFPRKNDGLEILNEAVFLTSGTDWDRTKNVFIISIVLRSFFNQNSAKFAVSTHCSKKINGSDLTILISNSTMQKQGKRTERISAKSVCQTKKRLRYFSSTQSNKFWDKQNYLTEGFFFFLEKRN